MIKKIKNNKGFTIVELIVTFSVITILASYMILYNKTNKSQIILSLEQAKLVDALNTAKSLTLSTYVENNSSCGYGVYINNYNTYTLFKYGNPSISNCSEQINTSTPLNTVTGNWIVIKTFTLDKNIEFNSNISKTLHMIFFVPPDPKIFIWRDGDEKPITETNNDPETYIELQIKDKSISKTIKVNVMGQISFN
jgi:prepilin-type N-terminal cleavage/methylation domain-containing protein